MGFFKKLKERLTKPKASVSLKIPKSTFELGEDLKGEILVSCQEEFDATEVRAELRCIKQEEKWQYNPQLEQKVKTKSFPEKLVSRNPKVGGPMHMVPGFKKTFPLSVNIPAGGLESFHGKGADGTTVSVTWSIKGVVGIKERPDVTSETIKLRVTKPSEVPKAVKVVLIPCRYCKTQVPETATECPTCGATDFKPKKSSG